MTKIARDFNKCRCAHSNEFKAIMKPCGFLVNTGSKQSELQTVDFVAVAVVILNTDAGGAVAVAVVSVVLFLILLFQVAFIILVLSLSNQKKYTKQRHTM